MTEYFSPFRLHQWRCWTAKTKKF